MFTVKALPPQPRAPKQSDANDLTQLGRGIVAGNPKLCITCRQPIRRADAWVTSSNGQYKIIRHARCSNGR